jgi:hypothetical protein
MSMTTRSRSLVAATTVAAALAATVPVHAAGIPKTNKCGNVATSNGAKAQYIRAYKVGCKTAKAVARRANGKKSFTASRFTCQKTGPTYLCTKPKSKSTIVFTYKKS